jgi:hypothetical protein
MEIVIKTTVHSRHVNNLLVLSETEKAYWLQNKHTKKAGWLPKKALLQIEENTYTFKKWFKDFQGGQAIAKAFQFIY